MKKHSKGLCPFRTKKTKSTKAICPENLTIADDPDFYGFYSCELNCSEDLEPVTIYD